MRKTEKSHSLFVQRNRDLTERFRFVKWENCHSVAVQETKWESKDYKVQAFEGGKGVERYKKNESNFKYKIIPIIFYCELEFPQPKNIS